MSNTISYDKNKLQTFISAYNDMNDIMASYNDKINNFQEAVQLLTDGFSSNKRKPHKRIEQYHFFRNTRSSNFYMMTHENILIKLKEQPNSDTEEAKIPIFILSNESDNILDMKENFNTVVEISGTLNSSSDFIRGYKSNNNSRIDDEDGNLILTVRAVYVGNEEFQNDALNNYWHVTNMMRYRNNNVQPNYWGMRGLMTAPLTRDNLKKVYKMSDEILIHGTVSGTLMVSAIRIYQKCIMESIYKRTGTNVPMIGLHQTSSGNCVCYDMTDESAVPENSIDYYEEEVYTSSNSNSMNYFGLFMDGRVMGLTENVYYNNFNDFFEVVDGNLVTDGIPNDSMNSSLSELNPFVGHGMHTFDIENINDKRSD